MEVRREEQAAGPLQMFVAPGARTQQMNTTSYIYKSTIKNQSYKMRVHLTRSTSKLTI